MIERKETILMAHEDDAKKIIEDLKKWNIEPEPTDNGFEFPMQHNNVIHWISVDVVEKMSEDEAMFEFTRIPIVHSFDEIQEKTLGKVVFNWK